MKLRGSFLIAIVTATLAATCHLAIAQSVTLVTGGEALYTIELPAEPDPMEQQAADELETYLAKIAGNTNGEQALPRADETPVSVEIGRAANSSMLQERAAADPSGFFIEVADDTVRLAGTTPTATCYAVYDLLEQLGCRWFMPGEIGEVVPRLNQVQLQSGSRVEIPDFTGRVLQSLPEGEATDLWALRNKLGGERFPASHSWNRYIPPEKYFEAHPEYFAEVDGKRVPSQLCTSNPIVAALVAQAIIDEHDANPEKTWFGIGPNDGGGFCECESCRQQDTERVNPFTGEVSITDRFLRFANAVAGQVHEVYPDIRFAFYAYHDYTLPPEEVMPDPSIVPAIAPISLCRLHGMGNSLCPERNFHQHLISEWTKVCPEVYHRGYSYNLAGPNLPMNYVSRWAFEIPYCERNGITGFRVETQMSWANYGPLGWVMAQLMWDSKQDIETVTEDFYNRFYGPAAKPMQLYWMYMDRQRRNAPYHTGNAVNAPDIYSGDDMDYLAQRLRDATRVSENDTPYNERVHIATQSWEYLHAFLRMRELAAETAWHGAHEALEEMRERGKWLTSYDPPLLHPRGGVARLERFWAPEIQQGYERVRGGNEKITGLGDRWATWLDPNDVGDDLRLYSRRVDDGEWESLRTYSESWSDQGLRYYRGPMWYRQEVEISPDWGGRRIMLWFGGVDERAKIWVNDIYIGEVETNGWQPVELEITHAVRFGRANLIAVKVVNEETNELGTGGITRPVMIWSPAREPQQAEE